MNANPDFRLAVATAAVLLATALLARGEPAPIPVEQLGAVATKQVEGEGLSITAAGDGARLRCAFQRLEGEATPDGLWLRSSDEPTRGERLRILAVSVGRTAGGAPTSHESMTEMGLRSTGRARRPAEPQRCPEARLAGDASPYLQAPRPAAISGSQPGALPSTGTVTVDDQTVRFIRPGITEEYSVSVDGIRQDFLVAGPPAGTGGLRMELALCGARAAPAADGATLTLDGSGRTLAYSRLRAADATGRELPARMEVRSAHLLAVHVDDANAVYPVRIDPTFSDADWVSLNSLPGSDGRVFAMIADSSGSLYFGGAFSAMGTAVASNVAKWDGSEWSGLDSGLNGPVWSLVVRGTNLYAGGNFTTAGGIPANLVAKWDGSAWCPLGSGISGAVLSYYPNVIALAVVGTDLYAGGTFSTAGGVPANCIARWDGSTWSALGTGMNAAVFALTSSGTNLYAGGEFTTAGDIQAGHTAKWDGSAWSPVGTGLGEPVHALVVSDTLLYAGGDTRVMKWNGSAWSTLGSGMGNPFAYEPSIEALAVMGTDLYAGGRFTTAGGVTVNFIARWNGSSWSALGSGMNVDGHGWVHALAVIGSDLYAGGEFTTAGGVPAWGVARWDGSQWAAMGSGMAGQDQALPGVHALAVNGTDLYVGGYFRTAPDGTPANHIAKWDGSDWSALGSGMGGPYAMVAALAVIGTDLYAAGGFTTAGGVPASRIAKWNGSTWSALGSGTGGPYPEVTALAVVGTDLYAGGLFTTAGGVPVNLVAKWNGSTWSALGSGIDSPYPMVNALAVIGTELYVGGYFTTAGGVPASNIAKWDGSRWSALGSGVEGHVSALVASGTDLYAGGIDTAGGVSVNSIARWDGSTWSELDPGSSGVRWNYIAALARCETALYAGGWSANSDSHHMIARWDGSEWSMVGSGLRGGIFALAADAHGHLFVGGDFVSAGNTVSPYIVQANITGLDFTWSAIPSPQDIGVPFPVTLTARSADGDLLTNFTDTASLSGYAPDLIITNVTLGAGAGAWGYPLHTRYHDARTQVIYPAGEIGRACTVTSLAIEVVSPPGQTLEAWTIRLTHTTLAKFPASPSWEASGWTGGYQGDEPAGAAGWRTFPLSAPFEYNGTDNVLVDFSFNNASYSAEGQCRATEVGSYRAITFATDSAYGDPLNWSGTSPTPVRHQTVPNLVLGVTYPDTIPVAVSPTITGPFVDGVWSGEVTVAESYAGVILRADDGLGHDGESNPFDVEAAVTDTDEDGLADAWELTWFPSLTNATFQTDWDGDGFRDGFECAAGTSPTDSGSFLGITSVALNPAGTEAVIRWSSVGDKLYSVYGGSDLLQGLDVLLDDHLPATPPVNVYTDTVEGVEMRTYGVEAER